MAESVGPRSASLHTGVVIASRYELVRHIARGGMGDVYEGLDRLLERRVAVKVYRAASPSDRARFDAEVRCLASLNHPGLVKVYDAGPWGDDAFVVLEFIDGPPLAAVIGDGRRLPSDRVLALGADLADALAYIHASGVVHRDVTPANVLCGPDGRPRLVDFGIARLLESPRVTAASIAIGTAAYMAPEQVRGQDVTPAADIYSLGLLLLEALTGRQEFVGSVQETATARLVRDPDTGRGVPQDWRPLLHQLCQRDPSLRPSAPEVRTRLQALREVGGDPRPAGVEIGSAWVGNHAVTAPINAATRTAELVTVAFAGFETDAGARRAAPRRTIGVGVAVALVATLALGMALRPHGSRPPRATATTLVATADTGAPTTTVARVARVVVTHLAPTTSMTATTATTAVPPATTTPLTFPTPPPMPSTSTTAPAGSPTTVTTAPFG